MVVVAMATVGGGEGGGEVGGGEGGEGGGGEERVTIAAEDKGRLQVLVLASVPLLNTQHQV